MPEKLKIGIFGSAIKGVPEVETKAQEMGIVLSRHDVILITGACTGLPYQVVWSAYQANPNIKIWGFSPATTYEEQVALTPDDDNSIYSVLRYVGEDFPFKDNVAIARKYRNVLSTATCDAGIVISGRWGTLSEFTNLFDMGKVIGVLTGTGGVADELPGLMQRISKPSKAVVIFDENPVQIVDKVLNELKRRTA